MRPTLEQRFRVRSYETDQHGRLQVAILCKLLQETATEHAARLGVAVDTLIDGGVAWVLSHLRLDVHHWPRADDDVVITTWPEAADRLFTERRFEVASAGGTALASASTVWLVMDLASRRPVRLPPLVVDALGRHDLGRRLARPEKLRAPDPVELEVAFTAKRGDLDRAGHVNNTSYVEWAIEAVPDELWATHVLSRLAISYVSECHRGQSVLSQCRSTDAGNGLREVQHRLMRGNDGAEVARAATMWRIGQTQTGSF